MSDNAIVAGEGMTKFTKPGINDSYVDAGTAAILSALADAGLEYRQIEQAYVGYVFGDSTCGQRVLYDVGMTGIPIVNLNNNCSTGSTALFMARQAIQSGVADCVLAVGFEQMMPGAIANVFEDRVSPFSQFDEATNKLIDQDLPLALRYFGGAGLHHMQKFGTTMEDFAHVRAKASRHAVHNPNALFRKEVTSDDVMQSTLYWDGVMTKLMACPPTCGSGAAILVSAKFAKKTRP